MTANVIRSRILTNLWRWNNTNSNNCKRIFSSDAVSGGTKKESVTATQSIIGDISAEPELAAAEVAPSLNEARKSPWRFLKYGIVSTLTGVTVGAGYVTYAYSSDEIEENTRSLRESVKYTAGDENYQGLLYTSALTVPAKAVEVYLDLRRLIEEQVRGFTEPTSEKLLPDLHPAEQHVFTLVLDLNETLLFSDWNRERSWRTFKRPGVDAFLEHMAKFYEIVVYSDQLTMYVDPVCERLDKNHCIRYRLSRDATKYQAGKHYRDLSKLNRDPAKILYVSGHAFESSLQPENCVPIKPYRLEPDDTALLDLIPFLEYVARNSPADIRAVLASYERKDIAKEFLERSKDYQRRMQEQRQQHKSFWRR